MARSEFWKARQAEFEKYAKQYPTLEADWYAADRIWLLSMPDGTRETRGGAVRDPYNVPQECKDIFNAITRRAATELPDSGVPGDAEPWRLWLDFMRARNWGFRVTGHTACTEYEWDAGVRDGKPLATVRREQKHTTGDGSTRIYRRSKSGKLRRLTARELKGKSSEDLQKYYHWLENGTIEHVFESSARFCEELAASAFEFEARAGAVKRDTSALIRGRQPDEKKKAQRQEFMVPFRKKETLSVIATRSGVLHSSLHRWHNGKSRLSAENRATLATYLKVDPQTIPN